MTEQSVKWKVLEDKIPKNVVRCVYCNKPLKLDNLGAIFKGKKKGISMTCKDIFCLIHFIEETEEVKP